MLLEGMERQIKYFFCCMDWVYYNDDFRDIVNASSLVDTTSDCDKLSFNTNDI